MVKKLEWIEMAQLATTVFPGWKEGKKEKGSDTLSGATAWNAEILRAGSSIKVQGQQLMESQSGPI